MPEETKSIDLEQGACVLIEYRFMLHFRSFLIYSFLLFYTTTRLSVFFCLKEECYLGLLDILP